MNSFDPNNLEEWIHNDWESDDWIASHSSDNPEPSSDNYMQKPSKFHLFLIALHALYFGNPFISFVMWIITIWLALKISGKIMDAYFIHEFPERAYLWQ